MRQFVGEEEADRNNRLLYSDMPSPKDVDWVDHIDHRLKMLENGIAAYTTDKYTRLAFDKYIRQIEQSV